LKQKAVPIFMANDDFTRKHFMQQHTKKTILLLKNVNNKGATQVIRKKVKGGTDYTNILHFFA
jgi:hypothetical protein